MLCTTWNLEILLVQSRSSIILKPHTANCHLFYQSLLIMLFFFQPSSSFFYSDFFFLESFSCINCKFESYSFYIFLQVTNEYLKPKHCHFGHHLRRRIKNISNPSVYTLSANPWCISQDLYQNQFDLICLIRSCTALCQKPMHGPETVYPLHSFFPLII